MTTRKYCKDKNRDQKLQKRYGITLEEYNVMLDEQNSRCKICGAHEADHATALVVDHCHETDKVRALLCTSCNVGIGHFKEDKELLLKAIDYLNDHKGFLE